MLDDFLWENKSSNINIMTRGWIQVENKNGYINTIKKELYYILFWHYFLLKWMRSKEIWDIFELLYQNRQIC